MPEVQELTSAEYAVCPLSTAPGGLRGCRNDCMLLLRNPHICSFASIALSLNEIAKNLGKKSDQ
jgi:hypothetical protein